MAKQRKTKGERLQLEGELADTMFYALTTQVAERAEAWARRAHRLAEGLSAAAVKRARKRARKLADDLPPGYVKASEATDAYDDICRRHRIPKRDQDLIWGAVAQVCMYQLSAKFGTFYEAARDFKLTDVGPGTAYVGPGRPIDLSARDGNAVCDCPNCRPRKAEELN